MLRIKEDNYIFLLFLLSLLNSVFGIVFYVGLLYLVYRQKEIGIVKFFLIATYKYSNRNTFKLFRFNKINLLYFAIIISTKIKNVKNN